MIHGAGSAGRYSIVFLALAILLPAMTPTLEQDFTLFYALYHCRVNAIWNLTCMFIAFQCLNHYIENDSQYFKQVFKFLVHLFHTHAFESHSRLMTAWFLMISISFRFMLTWFTFHWNAVWKCSFQWMPFIQSIHDFNLIAVHDYLKTIAGFISWLD